jgi:glycosyltransferase involved in cell wall biosynthesis
MKIAIISEAVPPSWSGQANLIYRLLKDRSPDEYCLISHGRYRAPDGQQAASPPLGGHYYQLSPRPLIQRGQRFAAVKRVNIRFLARQIVRIISQEKCSAIVAFSGNLTDLPAGYAASRIMNVPFYAYVCDYYSYQQVDARERALAKKLEPKILRGARGVIVLNEFLRDELKSRYDVESTIIHNPCDLNAYEAAPSFAGNHDGEKRIVYTGAVYDANYDAFRNLLKAIEVLGRTDVRLHIYTAQSPEQLAGFGIRGPVVFHDHVSALEIPALQKQADVLFLPLSFNSPYPEIIRTSAPFKLGEYLAARRPVIVHASPDSFVSWYFRRYGCGIVIDQTDPMRLAEGIERVLSDADLRQRLSATAWERAGTDFAISNSQAAFAKLLSLGQ